MTKSLDENVREFVESVGGYNACKRAGLCAMMQAYYCGMHLNECDKNASPDEIASDLELTTREYDYWDDLYYRKDSWFNNMN